MTFDPLPWPGSSRSKRVPSHVALLGNFPPRLCGLATYTYDCWQSLSAHPTNPTVDVYAMDDGQVEGYGPEITQLIPQDDITAYQAAADRIDASGAQVLWIQHEYGIFGGESGSHLLALINRVKTPIAVTLHTILENPNGTQRAMMDALLARSTTIIVMAEKGRDILAATHGIDPARVTVIPHGIPDRPLIDPSKARQRLELANRPTVLTFGLLSPDKGIADMIEAMPAIVESCPRVHYVVLGATHPHLKRNEGEAYRESLLARVEELGLADNVSFVDRFCDIVELTDWLAAADIYVTPYRNPAQITSGTLSYAIGLGKAVVSTPYVHATEILADEHGILVPVQSPAALGEAVARLLTDDTLRTTMAQRAYARGRSMIWPRNAENVLATIMRDLRKKRVEYARRIAPVLKLTPIERMTDSTGMLQHSIMGVPDRRHGYCIDDNARGLMLMALADDLPDETRTEFAMTYASFVQHAWNEDTRRFRNFMAFDRRWLEDIGSEDSNGRTLWSLAISAARGPSAAIRQWATEWYDKTSVEMGPLPSLRARAFQMLAAAEIIAVRPGDEAALTVLREGAAMLSALVARNSRPDWAWFEIVLSYDNTRLPEALIRAGVILGDETLVATGLDTLDWVSNQTTAHDGQFQPVGTESFSVPFAQPAIFDQQPLEAWAMIDACAVAWAASGDTIWIDRATAAHDWFLGANTLSVPIIDAETGECHDGLTRFDANRNQGAESIIAWQAGHRAFRGLFETVGDLEDMDEPVAEAA
ncbi:MAG: glycosyltransferase family 4 protein [Sphingomonadales bacterium]